MFKWRTGRGKRTTVNYAVDGDTIDVDLNGTNERVRLIGLDAPETNYPRGTPEPLANEARDFVMDGLAGKDIVLRQDKKLKNRDEYGRLLRYVELNGNDFGKQILYKGLAKVHGKGFKRRPAYRTAQRDAKVRRKGVWETRRTRARDFIPGKVF